MHADSLLTIRRRGGLAATHELRADGITRTDIDAQLRSGRIIRVRQGWYARREIHPEMLAYIFVGQNEFAAVVGKNGTFTIHGVPHGTYQIAVWNSHLAAAAQSVTVTDGKTASVDFSLARK